MVDAGLLANKQKLTNVELQSILTSQLGSEAKAQETMTSMGLSVAIEGEEAQTVQLTAKKLEQAVTSGILTEAQAQELAMTVGVTAAQNAQATSTMPKWIANMKAMTTATLKQVAATVKWLATNPVGWCALAVAGIAAVTSAFKNHKEKLEEQKQKIKELGEEAKSAIDQINSDLKSTKSTVDNVAKQYAQLAQEVGNLGTIAQNQGNLSNDDYSEFLDISNELADLFPTLTAGYDENGNAILDLNGDVQTITSSLYDMVDAEKAVANYNLQKNMPDLYSDFAQTQSDYAKEYNDIIEKQSYYNEAYNKLLEYDLALHDLPIDVQANIADRLDELDKENLSGDVLNSFSDLSQEEQYIIKDVFCNIDNEYSSQLNTLKKNIASKNKNFSAYVMSLLDTDSTYNELSNTKKRIVSSIISNAGYDTLLHGYDGDWDKAYSEEIEKNILNAIRDIDNPKIIDALNQVLSGDISAADYQKYAQIIQDYDEENSSVNFSKWFKPDEAEIIKSARTAKDRIQSVLSKNGIDIDNTIIDNFTSSLEPEQLDVFDNLEIDDESLKILSKKGATEFFEYLTEQINEKLSDAKAINIDIPTKIDTATAADSAKDAFDALNKALSDYETNGIKGMDINNLIALNNDDTFGNINGSTASLESFLAVMQDINATSEEVHNAFNTLASDYIYNSELAENITQSNLDWTASELKKNGVINNQAVAEQMLINKYGAEEVAINRCISANLSLNGAKLTTENATQALEDATISEIDKLIAEANASGTSATALGQYALQKLQAQRATITTDGDISNLLGLCDALNVSTQLVNKFIEVKNSLAKAIASNAPSSMITSIESQVNNLYAQIQAKIKSGSKANTSLLGNYYTSSSGNSSSGTNSSNIETFDWIETAITRTEESINRLDKTASKVYANWSTRNSNLTQEINKVRSEIDLQQKAYNAYINKANSVGLSVTYQQKIQNGTIQIETISDENLISKIKEYQEWYEKAISCQDAIQDLNITLGELAEQQFDNIEKEYSDLISIIENKADIIDERINRTQEQGYFASSSYYNQLLSFEQEKLKNLTNEYNSLLNKRNEAVSSGLIELNSESYQSMVQEIQDIQKSIEESTTAIVEFNNQIRELNWEIFDYIEDRISSIADESNFLIDVLSQESLYNENGSLNSHGESAIYLHGQNVNTYTQQLKDYSEELNKINSELANDKSNQNLIERREELLELQQESISNIYAEKEAVRDLVEEGINIHLESLNELIDKYRDSLNSAKNLYDYQKNISEQTSEISRLQKILNSYENDDSEEARKSIQEYQTKLQEAQDNLKETEWDKYISETEDLLTDLYDDYSETLNARLDDINMLFTDMIDDVNNNSNIINNTINSAAQEVGYTISLLNQTAQEIKNTIQQSTTYVPSLSSYATGSHRISNNQLAWTQENGSELIYRSSDGAILTPLSIGDKVFTNEMSENLWNIASNGIVPNSIQTLRIPNNLSDISQIKTNNNITNQNTISIDLPNVTSYEDFKRELQQDSKFINFVQETTLGRVIGRNKLNKNKY